MDQSCTSSYKENLANEIYIILREEEAILDTPDRFCRLLKEMMLPCDNAAAQRAAAEILEPEITLPWGKASVLAVLYGLRDNLSHVAIASIFRAVWIGHGLMTDTGYLLGLVGWIHEQEQTFGGEYLMTPAEVERLRGLPDFVTVYRGVLNDPKLKEITGHSWTLSKQVANYYTACTGRENGWILTAEIPREHVHLLFLERGEEEVVIDIRQLRLLGTERGQAKEFPARLAEPGAGIIALLMGL